MNSLFELRHLSLFECSCWQNLMQFAEMGRRKFNYVTLEGNPTLSLIDFYHTKTSRNRLQTRNANAKRFQRYSKAFKVQGSLLSRSAVLRLCIFSAEINSSLFCDFAHPSFYVLICYFIEPCRAVVNQVYVSISLAHFIKRLVSAKYSWSVSLLLPIVLACRSVLLTLYELLCLIYIRLCCKLLRESVVNWW